jgi:propionate CoA-transferase
VIVTYDGCRIDDDVAEAYGAMVAGLQRRFYGNVTRYSGSAFSRMKLGRILPGPLERPHLYRAGGGA